MLFPQHRAEAIGTTRTTRATRATRTTRTTRNKGVREKDVCPRSHSGKTCFSLTCTAVVWHGPGCLVALQWQVLAGRVGHSGTPLMPRGKSAASCRLGLDNWLSVARYLDLMRVSPSLVSDESTPKLKGTSLVLVHVTHSCHAVEWRTDVPTGFAGIASEEPAPLPLAATLTRRASHPSPWGPFTTTLLPLLFTLFLFPVTAVPQSRQVTQDPPN